LVGVSVNVWNAKRCFLERLLGGLWAIYYEGMVHLPKSRSYSRRSVGVMLVVGVLAGVTVGGGVGVIAASSSKSVTVCANKTTNMLRYAKDGKCVTKNESIVVLNQTGATGARGAPGKNATVAITQQSVCDGSDAGTVADELCKIGMTGPGGGLIFFVDYNDQYTGFDYLEAAPSSCEGTGKVWSSDTTQSLVAVNGWAARAVGAGKANSAAMIASGATSYEGDTSGAASFAEGSTCGTQTDWFLGSLGEMKLMYDNLQGVGGFSSDFYWSSSEIDGTNAWGQDFIFGNQSFNYKGNTGYVRPVRAF